MATSRVAPEDGFVADAGREVEFDWKTFRGTRDRAFETLAPLRTGLLLALTAAALAGCFVVPAPPPPGPGLRPLPPPYVAATPECGWQYGVGWYGWGWYGFACW